MSSKSSRFEYKSAVGLSYDHSTDECPAVAIKGERLYADRVVGAARRYGIPVVEDPDLACALKELELDQPIPIELYRAVAVVLSKL